MPVVRPLEPRFVLNATAELNMLGQLAITGDLAADLVTLDVDADGDLLLTDGGGATIAITNHPTDPLSRLAASDITSGEIVIDLGGGDDVLNLEIPLGLDVTVVDDSGVSAGDDMVTLTFSDAGAVDGTNLIQIDAETIQFETATTFFNSTDDQIVLTGDARIGAAGGLTTFDIGSGAFSVDGTFVIDGDVLINADGGDVDFSQATVSASRGGADLSLDLHEAGTFGSVMFGDVDDSGGLFVTDLDISETQNVSLIDGEIRTSGEIMVRNVQDQVMITSDLTSSTFSTQSVQDVLISGDVTTIGGLVATADQSLSVTGDLSVLGTDPAATISLSSQSIAIDAATLTTAGGDISLLGAIRIDSTVRIDSAAVGTVGAGGDVQVVGSVAGTDSVDDRLQINSIGTASSGAVTLSGPVGATVAMPTRINLNELRVDGGAIELNSARVTSGDILLAGTSITLTGPELMTESAGVIRVDGPLGLPDGDVVINAAGDVDLDQVTGGAGTQNLSITAGGDIELGSIVTGVHDLSLAAVGRVSMGGDLTVDGDFDVIAGGGIESAATSVESIGRQTFRSDLTQSVDGVLRASGIEFGGSVTVNAGVTLVADGPVDVGDLRKLGDGTLSLTATNVLGGRVTVEQGVVDVSGSISSAADDVTVFSGATLQGNGVIDTTVVVADGGRLTATPATQSLTISDMQLDGGAIYEVNIDSSTVFDSINVIGNDGDGQANLAGAELDLSVNYTAAMTTEFVLVSNDGVDPVIGNFVVRFDEGGNAIAGTRVLAEGDRVLDQFGAGGEMAYITYAGGDGNDVAIVTAGSVSIASLGTTIINRVGTNLHIRTGADLAAADAATPVIRPIRGIDGESVRVSGTTADDSLLIDVDGMFDATPGAVNFLGSVVFVGEEATGTVDVIAISDRDSSDDDSLEAVTYELAGPEAGTVTLTPRGGVPGFDVQFVGAEAVAQTVDASAVTIRTSGLDDALMVDASGSFPDLTQVSTSTNAQPSTVLLLMNPSDSYTFNTGDGTDSVVLNGFGSSTNGFRGALSIDGGAGVDSVSIAGPIQLGSGAVQGGLFVSAESISVSADIDTTSGTVDGAVEFVAGTQTVISSGASINVGDATLDIDGRGGLVDTGDGSLQSDNAGDAITIRDASSVVLGDVDVTAGRLLVGTTAEPVGNVSQSAGSELKVDRLDVVSGGSVILANVNNDFNRLDGIKASGTIDLIDGYGDLEISNVGSGGGDVSIRTVRGSQLLENAALNAGSGSVSLLASDAIDDAQVDDSDFNITAGQIQLVAGAGGIGSAASGLDVSATSRVSADTSGTSADIRLVSLGQDLKLGTVTAGDGTVTLAAESINDADVDELVDIRAATVNLNASVGIGNQQQIEIGGVDVLNASTTSGGIQVDAIQATTLTLNEASADSGDISIQMRGGGRFEVVSVTNAEDSVYLENAAGTVDLIGGGDARPAVSVGGTGDVRIVAIGNASDVIVRDGVQSVDGGIELIADRNVQLTADGSLKSVGGDVSIVADQAAGSTGGSVTTFDSSTIVTETGQVSVFADGDIRVSNIETGAVSDDSIRLQTDSGAVIDSGDSDVDLKSAGGIVIDAFDGIGASDAIETDVTKIDGIVRGVGGARFVEASDVELVELRTHDGEIDVAAQGTVVATKIESENVSSSDDAAASGGASSRDIRIRAIGDASDLILGSVVARNGADVDLVAGDDILDPNLADANVVQADDLSILAGNATDDGQLAVSVTTQVDDLQAEVLGANAGDLEIFEADAIRLASSDALSDAEQIRTSNGEIRIRAADAIEIRDVNGVNDGADLRDDVELSAGGNRGRVTLESGVSILIADSVQIQAEQISEGAITIQTEAVEFGDQIQLASGGDVGVARLFSPRPVPGVAETAFFDFTTVGTSTLEQSGANDGKGTLSLDVGRPGEQGLTVLIDWGAETARFQQIDGLSGDTPRLNVDHVYTEQDIVSSTLNGRTSSTKPLNVKFAVRHHESILVTAATVTQNGAVTEMVDGELVSSTDNPETFVDSRTPIYESGTASFIVPSLSIPVAFFPVREVIPTSVRPEVYVRPETSVTLSESRFETVEVATTTVVGRDEYFQIRALSPDPDGQDLAPPSRLPEDILSGDKLQDLFEGLPDGQYEIEYVVGDGNERSILKVDLRGGKPIVPGDDLDGGDLKLQLVDPDEAAGDIDPADQNDPEAPSRAGTGAATSDLSSLAVPVQQTQYSRLSIHQIRLPNGAGMTDLDLATRLPAEMPVEPTSESAARNANPLSLAALLLARKQNR